ncbi:acylamino-acid-releasing enzyme isoform X2 [Agrilus planipennis]|uniref:acylaminoacyl-peptidase n=2 Tax=Agrilus planipennis TaxID=224129 RepID=A0A7F5R0C2_AGRPL|nr:acylamino-acid-releasing enzyme isoform X1 [Agrilus planipennis]XP_025831070.1 acylamino-acid-releasing enzyme isoform X2 [Agrilus planipennis]
MVLEVDKIVKIYKSLAQIPALVGARFDLKGLVINSWWSQRNLDTGKTNKFLITHLVTQRIKSIGKTNGIDVSQELLSRTSPSENYRAVIREIEGKDSRKQLLEIWSHQNLHHAVDLSALELHGDVYADGELGSLEWAPDESKIVYIAEKKYPKTESFYKRKLPKKENNDESSSTPIKGEEYVFRQDWGEQLIGKKQSVIVMFDLHTEDIKILEGIPETVCPGQVTFTPDGNSIVGIALLTEPRKLGLLWCTNRPSFIFQLDFNGNYVTLSEEDKSVKSPRFTPDDKTLVWLQRNAGGPHHSTMALVSKQFPFNASEKPKVIVDVVKTEITINNNDTFYGLYNVSFPHRCWASERRLLLSTDQRNTTKSYTIDIDSGSITELKYEEGSLIILDVYDNLVLCNHRNFLCSDKLLAAQIPHKNDEKTIIFNMISKPIHLSQDQFKFTYLDLEQEGYDNVKSFTAMYIGPKTGDEKSVPLIVWPHGGPHSAFGNNMFLGLSIYLTLGYAVLLVNYRGSIGSGEDSVNFLLGKIGTADISDCVLAVKTALSQFHWLNPNQLVLVGGSHGGFIVLHLSGQYPDMFKVVVARNPVVDVAALSTTSDIPDWAFVETGFEYTQKGPLNEDELLAMRKLSPIIHAHKVKAPTLLQIGTKDLRVPPAQAIEYYHRLKANGVPVRMNLYEDNHSLSQVPHEIDNVINGIIWIDKYLNPT